ncbi:glycosyltransferase family 4 protein [Sphingobacterium sp. R2]|uniref:glycosyltransferase family 4 protein n=1 Tax=Sphingobacterium sp. R2 TaxID=3112958 RepID=UPI00345C6D1D
MKVIRISTIPLSLNVLLKGQLRFLKRYFDILGVSSSGPLLDEVSEREGIRVSRVEMERGISPFRDVISLIRLYLLFKREKPTIVHSITPKAGLLSMVAGKFAGVPIRIHTFTGLIFPSKQGFLQKILINMDKLLCSAATNIYPEGLGVRKDLISFKITSKPLKILANGNVNGIDLEYYDVNNISEETRLALKSSLGIDENDFVFVFVGRLVGDKGINELIEAFSTLERSEVKLLLVGPFESDLDPVKENTQREIETNPNIISVGFQKDVRSYFAISDALVFPSYREGFPNVVMQAGAMELPAIVSNINGCNEIILEGVNGTIIPVKDSAAICVALLRLLDDKQYYNKLKANSRKMIADRYEQNVVWNALLEEYKVLLANYRG